MPGIQTSKLEISCEDAGPVDGPPLLLLHGWPDRVSRIAMLSTPSRLGGLKTPSFSHARLQWYHGFQATRQGA